MVRIDGVTFMAVPNADRTEFLVADVSPESIATGSNLTDDQDTRFRVDGVMIRDDGLARVHVRLIQ